MAASERLFQPRGFLAAWTTFFLIWLGATVSFDPARTVAGLLVTGAIAACATAGSPFWKGLQPSPRRLFAGLGVLALFLRDMIASNIAVLGYVYSPKVRVAPQVIAVPVPVAGPRERLALTNMLALTPGSLVLEIEDRTLAVHLLDARLAQGTRDAVPALSRRLEKAFG